METLRAIYCRVCEIMYVYTLKYVYRDRIHVYMYLYVNKDSLLNLALDCGIFDFFREKSHR